MTVLAMACPTKRSGSNNWYFRRRIPADVQRILAALPRAKRPPCWHTSEIWISLRTADRAAAKAKCPEVAARVEKQMKMLREGPKELSAKHLSALSGLAYKTFTESLGDDPVLSTAQWREVAEANREATRGDYGAGARLGIYDDAERRAVSLEARFGRIVDAVLRSQSIWTTDASRKRLIEMLSHDLTEAAERLARNAEGDYTPDAYAQRFPPLTRDGVADAPTHSLTGIASAWSVAALARGVKSKTAKTTYPRAVERFVAFLGHDDAPRVTRSDVVRWADHRSAAGIAARTINGSDLAALSAVFAWAVDRGCLSSNPAEGVHIKARGKAVVRHKHFTSAEARAILSAAKAVVGRRREAAKTTAAKRWVPWLCAYSGARVSEMVQIRKQDIREVDGRWIMRLTPAAGSIKTNHFRDVPVHEHLIAEGFLDFVKESADGHLFCNIGKNGTISGAADGVSNRVRTFIRKIVSDPNVQPNHAWRYTFKTRGHEAGISERTLDAICGHAPKTQGAHYTDVTPTVIIGAMDKFPRYAL